MRHDECITCGDAFSAPYRHPACEEGWCPACLVIVRETTLDRFQNVIMTGVIRAEEV